MVATIIICTTGQKWVKVNPGLYEDFANRARKKGLDPNQLLEDFMDEWEEEDPQENPTGLEDDEQEEVPTDKLNTWQDDLQHLIRENLRSDNWFTKLIFWSLLDEKTTYFSGFS